MKLGILNSIIDFLNQKSKEMFDSTEKIQKHQTETNEIQKPKNDNQIQKSDGEAQKPKSDNEIKSPQPQMNQKEILSKIKKLKKSDDFESIYNLSLIHI